jgi:hypothetical protein
MRRQSNRKPREPNGILEPQRNGEIVAIHLDTEDYEIAQLSALARALLRARHAEGMIATMDIGPGLSKQLLAGPT